MAQLYYSLSITTFIILTRIAIIFFGGKFFDGGYLGGIILSYIPNFLFIYLFSLFLFPSTEGEEGKKKKKKQAQKVSDLPQGQLIAITAVMTLYFFSLLSTFFYESVFTKLPSKGIFFYLGQVKHLQASLGANAPVLIILILVAVFSVVSWYLRKRFSTNSSPLPVKNFVLIPALIVLSLILHMSSNSFSDRIYSGTRHSLFHLVGQVFDKSQDSEVIATGGDFSKVHEIQKDLGQIPPRGSLKDDSPFCEDRSSKTVVKNPRSVIVLILEGLGVEQLNKKVNGELIVPHLRKVLTTNLTFVKLLAAGAKSSDALPALFSGMPPQFHSNLLWIIPPPRVRGIPNILGSNGYRTSYFHGSDLSFEHQREFLDRIGFQDIVEYDPESSLKKLGWGYSDGDMYEKLKKWIKENGSSPYFTSLFTLSTHDPYILPQSWKPKLVKKNKILNDGDDWFSIWKNDDNGKRMAAWESYVYADTQFKKFYDWYNQFERPKGTLLVVVGDHYPYYIERGKTDHNKFHVPLSIIGLSNEEIQKYKGYLRRRGSQYDFPATLAHLLEYERHPCDQGLNLLATEDQWPKDRAIYAMGGESHEKLYFWRNKGQGFYDKNRQVLSLAGVEQFGSLSKEEMKPFLFDMKRFIENIRPIQAHTLNTNTLFPPDDFSKNKRAPLKESNKPIFVSHRGNTEGPGTPANENSLEAIEKVVASPFKWIELDIQITSDGIPILVHDPTYKQGNTDIWLFTKSLAELRQVPLFKNVLTLEEVLEKYSDKLNFLIEGKNQKYIAASLDLGRKLGELAKKYGSKTKIIIDSFDNQLISAVNKYCDCETGWDTPFQKPVNNRVMDFAVSMGMDWIYIHHKVLSTDLMKRAHKKGLKVMVYTVNKNSELKGSSIKPDGVITDTKSMLD